MTASRHRLGSTYRLQLNGLGFDGAAELVPFLHDLGIETCYLSPITAAMPSSTHGYDVIDPTVVDPSLGGAAGLDRLLATVAAHDMSVLIDIVPNHLAASPANRFFHDLLRHGRRSEHAAWFDVNWQRGQGRIVLPVLDGSVADAVRSGQLRVDRDPRTGGFAFRVGSSHYPIADIDPGADDLAMLLDLAGADPRGDRGVARQIELVESHQHYRLTDWRAANREVNYRRFFAINELIGIRQEDPAVFAATHVLVAELARDERISGFRVDHVDGMRDPTDYLERLRSLVDADGGRHVIVVEKILARDESLPAWPVDGTTGYDAAVAITGCLVDPRGLRSIAAEQAEATGDYRSFRVRAITAKRYALATMFAGSVAEIAGHLAAAGVTADSDSLRAAVEALTANLAVYRTYRRDGELMHPDDVARVRAAAADGRQDLGPAAQEALDEVVVILTGPVVVGSAGLQAVQGWQQLTSATMAKGVEDSASFDAGQLLAVCEVGADPDDAIWSVGQWHRAAARRRDEWPRAMTATSTHDSKRSLDLRCRLAVLSELGSTWSDVVEQLDAVVGAERVGAAARRYLYQTLVGAWPMDGDPTDQFLERIHGHLVKAAREAGVDTSWTDIDAGYESAYQELATALVRGPGRELVAALVEWIAPAGTSNALAAVVLGATAPGVPDIYQGEDLWSFALTDPDNRRPVDWARHRQPYDAAAADPTALLADWRSGRIKQAVLGRCLRLRRQLGEWWDLADYTAIEVGGWGAGHVIAFARTSGNVSVVTVVPCLPYRFAGPGAFPCGAVWGSSEILLPRPKSVWRDVLSDRAVDAAEGRVRLALLFDPLPVAVLETASP